ncbi:hypothetical protein GJ496_004410 [Pomphorhynchus laevis]|nr:hypothetical protein GJ496_004410 [Pomphorhynchus laevis]
MFRTCKCDPAWKEPLDTIVVKKFLSTIYGLSSVTMAQEMAMCLPPRNGGLGIHIFSKIVKGKYENSKQMCACFNSGLIGDDLRHLQDLVAKHLHRKTRVRKTRFTKALSLTHGVSAMALKEA